MAIETKASPAHAAIRRTLLLGVGAVALLVGGVGGWAFGTSLSGAVITQGQVVVESDVKKVQHPTGGVVGELKVRNGDRVKAGDILVRLDETQTRANLQIVTKALDELAARGARDEAERDGLAEPAFPADLLARRDDEAVARVVEGERRLFTIRAASRDGQRAQLRQRIAQLNEEVTGVSEQVIAKGREIALIQEELKGVRELWQKNLIQFARVNALERDAARIQGERGQLVATVAQAKGKIVETELQILQVEQDLRTEVGKDLADIRGKVSELVEKKIAAEDMLKRVDLRAPQGGTVHQMTVHTVGGLVTPSEPVMLIVPEADDLSVEVKVQPQDIDNVRRGQITRLRFSAFNQRTTPEIDGQVSRVSADVTQDQKTGLSYYTARVSMNVAELDRLGEMRLQPGMPVEAFIQTGDRTVISYLTKPLTDQIARAWRER